MTRNGEVIQGSTKLKKVVMKTSTLVKLECFLLMLSSYTILLEVPNDDPSVHKALPALVSQWKTFNLSSTHKMENFAKTGFRKGRCTNNSRSGHLYLRTTPTSKCTSTTTPTFSIFKTWDTPTDNNHRSFNKTGLTTMSCRTISTICNLCKYSSSNISSK